jgi:hypothetical protein
MNIRLYLGREGPFQILRYSESSLQGVGIDFVSRFLLFSVSIVDLGVPHIF